MPRIFKYMADTYGPLSGLYLGPRPTVIVSDAKLLKEIYKLDYVIISYSFLIRLMYGFCSINSFLTISYTGHSKAIT